MPLWMVAVIFGCIVYAIIPEKKAEPYPTDLMGEPIVEGFVEIDFHDTEEYKRYFPDEVEVSTKCQSK